MSDKIQWRAVATSLAALSPLAVSAPGQAIKIMDFAHIPSDCKTLCPILFPWTGGTIKNLRPQRHTLAIGSVLYRIDYSMTWRYLHAAVAGGLSAFGDYDGFMANMDALYAAILINADYLTGAKTIILPDIPGVGPTFDPSYNYFHGCDLTFQVVTEI
jgi:hypothetical protein